jgi:hypothetical protein
MCNSVIDYLRSSETSIISNLLLIETTQTTRILKINTIETSKFATGMSITVCIIARQLFPLLTSGCCPSPPLLCF